MKTPQQWVAEHTQSGAFDQVESVAEAERIVEQIQLDAQPPKSRSTMGILPETKGRVLEELFQRAVVTNPAWSTTGFKSWREHIKSLYPELYG